MGAQASETADLQHQHAGDNDDQRSRRCLPSNAAGSERQRRPPPPIQSR
jgi:hypothetical protein